MSMVPWVVEVDADVLITGLHSDNSYNTGNVWSFGIDEMPISWNTETVVNDVSQRRS